MNQAGQILSGPVVKILRRQDCLSVLRLRVEFREQTASFLKNVLFDNIRDIIFIG